VQPWAANVSAMTLSTCEVSTFCGAEFASSARRMSDQVSGCQPSSGRVCSSFADAVTPEGPTRVITAEPAPIFKKSRLSIAIPALRSIGRVGHKLKSGTGTCGARPSLRDRLAPQSGWPPFLRVRVGCWQKPAKLLVTFLDGASSRSRLQLPGFPNTDPVLPMIRMQRAKYVLGKIHIPGKSAPRPIRDVHRRFAWRLVLIDQRPPDSDGPP